MNGRHQEVGQVQCTDFQLVLQICDKIVQNEKKFMKIYTVLGLCILKTSGLGTISVSVPKSNMAAKFKMAAFYAETSQFDVLSRIKRLKICSQVTIYIPNKFTLGGASISATKSNMAAQIQYDCHSHKIDTCYI